MFWLTMRQLKSGPLKVRMKAAKDLWREPNPRALSGLAEALLSDPDAEIRQVAASAIGRLQVPERIEPLMKALADDDPEVIRSALLALRRVTNDKLINHLV